jgi:hypothetical protein
LRETLRDSANARWNIPSSSPVTASSMRMNDGSSHVEMLNERGLLAILSVEKSRWYTGT